MKKFVLVAFVVLVSLSLISFTMPAAVHVSRAMRVDRPASVVYANVDNYAHFSRWSPWHEKDPNMQVTLSGPASGVGAKLAWAGNDKVGTGTQEIIEVVPNRSVKTALAFDGMGPATSTITLRPDGGATEVIWSMDAELGWNPIARYAGLMMDKWVGGDYERGLAKLKAFVETQPNTDISGVEAKQVELPAQNLLYVTRTTSLDTAAISKAYAEAFAAIGKVIGRQKLQAAGPPIGIDVAVDAQQYTFDAAMPVDRADAKPAGDVKARTTAAGPALNWTYVGPYEGLGEASQKFAAWAQIHGHATGPLVMAFVDDPAKVPPDQLRTELYLPIG